MAKTVKREDKYSRFNDDGYGIRPIKSAAKTTTKPTKKTTKPKNKG